MRLIDADALLDKVKDYGEGQERLLLIDPYWVRKAPTIERPHGEWIRHIDDLYPVESTEECSICHEEQRITGNDDNFCPNCGADMRKKEGDTNDQL